MKALVFQHAGHESPGRLGEMMRERGFDIRTVNLGAGEPVPSGADGASLLVLMGGPMGVYETREHPYLPSEIRFTEKFIKDGGAAMGICLGAQIMAASLGAKVAPGRAKEIGWYDISMTAAAANDPVFSGFGARRKVFQWHGDGFETPGDAVNLAFSDGFPSQAFRYGDRAYDFQFHMEVDGGMVRHWLGRDRNRREVEQGDFDARGIEAGIGLHGDGMRALAEEAFGAFLKLV